MVSSIAVFSSKDSGAQRTHGTVDVTWLRMDRPANLMIIVGVLVLAGPVDVKRLQATLANRILAYGRFRKRVETRTDSFYWCDDPILTSPHIKRTRLPEGVGKAELWRFVAELAGRPLDHAHPLWEFHIVEDYEGGAAVVVNPSRRRRRHRARQSPVVAD